jgi:CRP-like cAMP-binding protein
VQRTPLAAASRDWANIASIRRCIARSCSPRGREQTLHVESAGATLTEGPLFDGGGYVATARAETEARLLFVPRPVILDLCRRRPEVALGVITVLAQRVRAFAAVIEDLALRNVTAASRLLLLTEARRDGNAVDLSGTREEVALRLGTARELVSRSLSQLRAAGVIVMRGRRVWLTDEPRLAGIADLT